MCLRETQCNENKTHSEMRNEVLRGDLSRARSPVLIFPQKYYISAGDAMVLVVLYSFGMYCIVLVCFV